MNTNSNLNDDGSSRNNVNGGTRRTRGPINKRACQRCRQGKIKCDGNAEAGTPCSNCDSNTCKYDNSPRKNKQVEALRQKLDEIEEKLRHQTTAAENLKSQNDRLQDGHQIKTLEKVVLIQLFENRNYFKGYETTFDQLLEVLRDSKAIGPVIQLIQEHLNRLPGNLERISDIMGSFSSLAANALLREPESNYGNVDSQNVITAIQSYISGGGEIDPNALVTPTIFTPTQPSSHLNTNFVPVNNIEHLTSPGTNNFGLTQLSIHSPSIHSPSSSISHDAFTPPTQDLKYYNDGCEHRPNDLLSDTTFNPSAFPGYFENASFFPGGGYGDVYIGSGGGDQMDEEYYGNQ